MPCNETRHYHVELCVDVHILRGHEAPTDKEVAAIVAGCLQPPVNDWDSPARLHSSLGEGRSLVGVCVRED